MRAAAAAQFLALLAPWVCRSATIHVPGDQSTIQLGIDAAATGDTVHVACGTYLEHDISLKSGVVVRADAPGCVIVDAESLGRVFQGSFLDSTTVLSGFVAREGNAIYMGPYGTYGGGLALYDGSPRIENCIFENNYAESGGGVAAVLSEPRLDECVFRVNAVYGSFPAVAAGIYAVGGAEVRAHRCLFQVGGNVGCREGAKVTLSRCTFAYSSLFAGAYSEVIADRSIFYESSVSCFTLWNPGRGEVTCSLVESLSGCIEASDNVSGDPLFCDPESDDFTVSGSSPCLQADGPCQGLIGAFSVGCDEEFVNVVGRTSPVDLPMVVDGDTTITPATFVWPRFSEHEVGAVAEHRYAQGRRYAFDSWSDAGERVHDALVLNPPYEFVAFYEHQFELEIFVDTEGGNAQDGGFVLPSAGWFPADEHVEIHAVPHDGFAFASWAGSGEGSYTGTDNPATVSMHGPLTQVAHFVPIGYEFGISASPDDAGVHHSTPSGGFRNLYLWLTCANGGFTRFEASTTGTLSPLAFVPAEGILSAGSATDLDLLALDCLAGEAAELLLGHWFVHDTGGTFCLGPPSGAAAPRVSDCSTIPEVTLDPGVTGFSSDGAPPCRVGSHTCASNPTNAPARQATGYRSTVSSFSVAPNPFAERTTVTLFLTSPAQLDVRVFDVAGRFVTRLAERSLPTGPQRLLWDGRDHAGRRVAGGTYFVRLEAAGERMTRKVVFLGN
jgi:hypothetical protein